MHLIEIPPPNLFPAALAGCAVRLPAGTPRDQFLAGRRCAGAAIRRLVPDIEEFEIRRGPAGEPLWPRGLTGSITHKGDLAWAVVARTTHALSIGIDAERVCEPGAARRISEVVLRPEERLAAPDSLSLAERVSLIFSIKEAVFKCLYPLVSRPFYYDALAVTAVDRHAGGFRAVLAHDLSAAFAAGYIVTGSFIMDEGMVFAGIYLPAPNGPADPSQAL